MKKVAKNSLVGMLVSGAYLVSRILLTPYILAYVSLEEFGLWSFCFVIISFAGLSGTGISSAFIKFVAEFHAGKQEEKIGEILAAGMVVLTVAAAAIMYLIWYFTPLLLDFFVIEAPDLRITATFLIRGSVTVFLFDLILSGFKSLLDGLQEIALSRSIWLTSTLIEAGCILLFLTLGWGIKGVFWGYAIRCFLGTLCYIYFALRKINIQFKLSVDSLKLLYSFGGKMQILSFIGIFMTTFDRLVITRMLGLNFAGLFEVGRKFPLMGASVTASALDSLLPASSALHSEKNSSDLSFSQTGQWKRYFQVFLGAIIISGFVILAWPIHEWGKADFPFSKSSFLTILIICLIVTGFLIYFLLKKLFVGIEPADIGDELKELYLEGGFYLNLLNIILFAFLAACSPKIIFVWVGPYYNEAAWVLSVLSISVAVNLATGPGTAILRGIGKPEGELEYALLNLILAIIWVPGFTHFFELPGAVLGTALSTIIASVYFIFFTNRLFKISFTEYIDRSCSLSIFPVIGAVLSGASLFLFPPGSRWATAWQILLVGILYLLFNLYFLRRYPAFAEVINLGLKKWKIRLTKERKENLLIQ